MESRQRGSLLVPEKESELTTVAHAGSKVINNTYYNRFYRHTSDVYEKYGQGRWRYKPFQSVKVQTSHIPQSYGDQIPMICNGWDDHDGVYSGELCPPASERYLDSDHWPSPDQAVLGRLGGRIEARLPSLRPDFDLFVFLAEIREVADLLHMLEFQAGGLLDKLSGKNLELHFAVFPFFGEMQNICKILAGIFHRHKIVLEGAGKVHDLKTTVSVPEEEEVTYEDWLTTLPYGCTQAWPTSHPCCKIVLTKRTTSYYSATVKYRYAMPEHATEFGAKLAKILTAIGLAPDITSYWNVVPFSFVVDWIFNTKRLFQTLNLDGNGLDVSTEIIDCAVVQRVSVTENREYHRPCMNQRAIGTTGGKTEFTYMKRWVGSEAFDMLHGPWFKLPGFMQLHLGASLLWQLR